MIENGGNWADSFLFWGNINSGLDLLVVGCDISTSMIDWPYLKSHKDDRVIGNLYKLHHFYLFITKVEPFQSLFLSIEAIEERLQVTINLSEKESTTQQEFDCPSSIFKLKQKFWNKINTLTKQFEEQRKKGAPHKIYVNTKIFTYFQELVSTYLNKHTQKRLNKFIYFPISVLIFYLLFMSSLSPIWFSSIFLLFNVSSLCVLVCVV